MLKVERGGVCARLGKLCIVAEIGNFPLHELAKTRPR
jgi:hypothetical protein